MENNEHRELHKHNQEKECEIRFLKKEYVLNNIINIFFCETHGVELCRCGMEWGWHSGQLASTITD